jgi:hypothetical protein
MDLLLRLFVGHLIGDFILQTNNIAELKLKNIKYLFAHVVIVFLSLLICTLDYLSFNLIFVLAIISLIHLIDYLKKFTDNFLLFIIDQTIHVVSLILVPAIFGYIDIYLINKYLLAFYTNINLWVYAAGYIFGIFAAKVMIDNLLKNIIKDYEANSISGYIGMIERLIVITLALLNEYTAIGIIFAIKGVARSKFIDNDVKNGEYYFLGTGLSFFLAILTALVIKKLLV